MKCFVVLAAVILSAQAGVKEVGWGSGWPSTTTPPPTTTGWPATDPPTTGWPAPPPPTTGWPAPAPAPGWPAPSPGWPAPPKPVSSVIDLAASLAASGIGWSGQHHADNVVVSGDDSVPADINLSSSGSTVTDQLGAIGQLSSINNADGASSVNQLSVAQVSDATEGLALIAHGLNASAQQNGWTASTGSAASQAGETSNITVN